jgi:hypothetical protein
MGLFSKKQLCSICKKMKPPKYYLMAVFVQIVSLNVVISFQHGI